MADLKPSGLPPCGSPERWPWLQRLRREQGFDPEPWVEAIEDGLIPPEADVLTVLAPRLDAPLTTRLLEWWMRRGMAAGELPSLLGHIRHPVCAAFLREAAAADPMAHHAIPLLSLLGHQRDPGDFPLLSRRALEPAPIALRRAALEGILVGLSAWPLLPLRRTLTRLASDLDVPLAAQAVDGLSRLPGARGPLMRLRHAGLDPGVAARVERRLVALPAAPLLLVVHGRAGGVIPPEILTLVEELRRRRGTSVLLHALTAEQPPEPIPVRPADALPLTVVPLFLLPGSHVRQDLPRLLDRWRASGPLRCLPFLGAWPAWQLALAEEVAALIPPGSPAPGGGGGEGTPRSDLPLLLHHPIEGGLGARYLAHLEAISGGRCRATPYGSPDPEMFAVSRDVPVLPLALAANRLTESLAEGGGPPLLARPRFRQVVLETLEAQP